jgi:hypothetical protein
METKTNKGENSAAPVQSTAVTPDSDPKKSKAFQAYLESVKEHSEVYRRLSDS